MRKRDITVRMAKNDDGDAVAALMKACGFFQWDNWSIDWHDLEPNWLVAEHKGTILGCIQVVPARPIGRMEVLAVDPSLGLITRGAVVLLLTDHAIGANLMYGSQAVASSIPSSEPDYFHHAMDRGWVELDEGSLIMRRLV